jgi:hypothetical protein
MQLIIDDGVAGRGHRVNCFSDNKMVGIATADHSQYETCTVFVFTGGMA